MKKTIIFIAMLSAVTGIHAQISTGILAGANFSRLKQNLDYSNDYFSRSAVRDLSTATCFVIGIPVEAKLSEKISVYTEIKYLQKGMKVYSGDSITDGYLKTDGTTKYNYLELPLQVKYYITTGKIKTYVMFGPSFGYAIKGHFSYEMDTDFTNEPDIHETEDGDLNADDFKEGGFNRFDICLTVGAGISYKAGPGSIFFNAGYYYGFIDMMNDDKVDLNRYVTQYHRGVTAVFGYMITL